MAPELVTSRCEFGWLQPQVSAASNASCCPIASNVSSCARLITHASSAADSSKVDIFAAGCVLYVLLTGRLPSEDYTRVKINERFPLVDSLRRIEQAHALLFALEAMVDSRPERRPSADDLLSRKEYFG